PRAVPSIWRVFVRKGEVGQRVAIRILGQIDAVSASQALSALSVNGATPEIRRLAAENLRRRDRREFLNALIMQVHKPLKYELKPNPNNNAMELFVEGVAYDLHRTYEYPVVPGDPNTFFNPYFARPGTGPARQIASALMQRSLYGANPVDP